MVEKALQEYSFPGYAFLWTEESRAAKVGRFLLQFQETDWEFIKRVASIEHLGLIPDMTGKQPRFFIGLPKGREEKIVPPCKHTVHRLLEKAEKEVANDNVKEGVWQGDYLQYRLYDVIEHYDIGDVVRFAQEQYIVVEKTSILKKEDGILRNDYVIQKKKGISFPRLYNHALRGNSLTGTVIDVKRNFTKLHLHIDQEGQEIETAFWFPQPQYFTAGSDSGFCIMPERGDMMRLHFPTKDESEHYIICSDNGDFGKLFEAIHASRSGKEEEKPSAPPLSDSNAPYEKYLSTPGRKGMLLNDGMIKYHTTGDISTIQIEDGKGVTISSEGNIELLANNISLNGGEKIKLSAEKKIEMTCGGSSIVIDGEEEREDFKAMELYLESPFNVDVDIMPPSEVEKLFRAFAEERKRELPQFTPDGIPITLENKFDDAIYNYLYEYWKTNSGEYDPKKDVIPESEMNKMHPKTKNEKKFEQWLLQQYGMTKKEERGYTLEGNLDSLWEIFSAADMVLLVKALPNIGKNLAKLGKNVLENGIQFDTSLGIVAGGGEIWNLKNTVDDVAEEAIEKTMKKEMTDMTEDLSRKTVDKDDILKDSSSKEKSEVSNTRHGNQRLKERGFTDERVRNIIENYSQKVYQEGGRTVYAKKNGNYYDVIIINAKGEIVTAVGGNTKSLKTWKDVTKMLNNNGGYSTLPY